MIETSIGKVGSAASDNRQAATKMIAPIDEPLVINSNVVLDKVNFEDTADASKTLPVYEAIEQLSEKSSTSSKGKQEEEEVKATMAPSNLKQETPDCSVKRTTHLKRHQGHGVSLVSKRNSSFKTPNAQHRTGGSKNSNGT